MADPAAPAAPAPPELGPEDLAMSPLFQIFYPFEKHLALLREYAAKYGVLQNCANLSFVYLGMIKRPKAYLETCTPREAGTNSFEISDTLRLSLRQVGYNLPPLVEGKSVIALPVTAGVSFGQRIREIAARLNPLHATLLPIRFENGSGHVCVLRKKGGGVLPLEIELVDPQLFNPDGSYPLRVSVNEGALMPSPYVQAVTFLNAILGPTIDAFQVFQIPFNITGEKGFLMNVMGGSKTRKSKRRASRRLRSKLKPKSRLNK